MTRDLTPEERADIILRAWERQRFASVSESDAWVRNAIVVQIREAVRVERFVNELAKTLAPSPAMTPTPTPEGGR